MIRSEILQVIGIQNADEIKNIVFDLGNVLIDIDLSKTIKKFHQILPETYYEPS